MALKMKFSKLKWFVMEVMIASFFSVNFFDGAISRIYDGCVLLWLCLCIYEVSHTRAIRFNGYAGQVAVLLLLSMLGLFVGEARYISNSISMISRVLPVIVIAFSLVLSIRSKDELLHVWRPFFIGGVLAALYQISGVNWALLGFSEASNSLRVSVSSKVFVNTYAYQMTLSFVCGYFLWIYCGKSKKKNQMRLLILVGMGLLLLGMFLTGSRKVLFAAAIFLFIAVCYGRKHFWKATVCIAILLIGYQILLNVPAFYNTIGWRIEMTVEDSYDKSAIERDSLAQDAVRTGLKYMAGVGLDNSKYYATSREVYAHNNYLEFFADFGPLGMLCYYLFYVYYGWRIIRNRPETASDRVMHNFYIAAFVMQLALEWYQIVYYNQGYHFFIAAMSIYATRQRKKVHLQRAETIR